MDDERLWDASIDDLVEGFVFDQASRSYCCLLCDKRFEKGVVYPDADRFYEADRAVIAHVQREHGSLFDYFINLNKRLTGLTDQQKAMMRFFHKGLSDKAIVEHMPGVNSASTVRQYRFKLKEKERQAKIFLTLVRLMERQTGKHADFMPIHRGATMVDDRYAITKEEQEKIIANYFTGDGKLKAFPRKEKRKIVILSELVRRHFNSEIHYTEQEVNDRLKPLYADYVTLRRYLIEYGFLARERDGRAYWVKG